MAEIEVGQCLCLPGVAISCAYEGSAAVVTPLRWIFFFFFS
jgi:hypothetical protein